MSNFRKGIILAGGNGSRLNPITKGTCKQLLPIYNKPMIYYPLSTLMLSGIREFLIITNPKDKISFECLLGNGRDWGIEISYRVQSEPKGIAEAFLIGEDFIKGDNVVLILGDNLFYGDGLLKKLQSASMRENGATIFGYPVNKPNRYGVINFDKEFKVTSIEEKPITTQSKYAITGLYYYDDKVVEIAKTLSPSSRGELEITDINKKYLEQNLLNVETFSRGIAWLDTGTFDSLIEAGSFVKTLEKRQGLKIGYPEEIAWRSGWITDNKFSELISNLNKNNYRDYLYEIFGEAK